jgi:hypothetical protein
MSLLVIAASWERRSSIKVCKGPFLSVDKEGMQPSAIKKVGFYNHCHDRHVIDVILGPSYIFIKILYLLLT